MREIKFKLIKDNKIVGYELHRTSVMFDDRHIEIYHSIDQNEWWNIYGNPNAFIKHDDKNPFTGLHDSKGNEIWEGDIVNCYDREKLCGMGEVKFGRFMSSHEGGCSRHHYHQGFYISGNDEGQIWNNVSEDIEWEDVEVIGNIYSNPDLMEKKQ